MTEAALAQEVVAWVTQRRDRILEDLKLLASVDAPSGEIDLLDGTAALLHRRAVACGGRVRRWPTDGGSHLEVRFGPAEGRPVLVLCHYDTVWPRGTAAARPVQIEDGVVHGPGVFDMRGGVVAALNGIAALAELGELNRPVVLALTADEETGSATSEELVVKLGDESAVALIPEPPLPDGSLKTERKGVLGYRLTVDGRAAHAGLEPERGASAVHALLATCLSARGLAAPDRGTTVNVGVFHGGTRGNVVAAHATAELDVRVATLEEYEAVESWFASLDLEAGGARLRVERLHGRPPLERTPSVAAAAQRARELARLVGLDLGEGRAGGGSDGNFLACRGVAVVDGLGPVGGGAHAADEHIVLDSLFERTALLALLAASL